MKEKKVFAWGDYTLSTDEILTFKLEPILSVYMQKVANEVWIANEHINEEELDGSESSGQQWSVEAQQESSGKQVDKSELSDEPVSETTKKEQKWVLPNGVSWSRWVLRSNEFELSITPIFPELPFVVRPEYDFHLLPQAKATIYVRIPVTLQIFDKKAGNLKIAEIPSLKLSRTWFGEFTDGEMCYWFKTTARRTISDEIHKPHLCVCPIHIKNDSDEELQIDKLCLRAERLSIYQDNVGLWSDLMTIEYKGDAQYSDLVVSGNPPAEAKKAKLIGKPRNPVKRGLAQRTFRMFNELHSKIG